MATRFNNAFIGNRMPAIDPDRDVVVPGIDGQKMSKSYHNTIEIFGPENPEEGGL